MYKALNIDTHRYKNEMSFEHYSANAVNVNDSARAGPLASKLHEQSTCQADRNSRRPQKVRYQKHPPPDVVDIVYLEVLENAWVRNQPKQSEPK